MFWVHVSSRYTWNFLFCTILANRSLGKDLAAPRHGDVKTKRRGKKKKGESNYISIYGYGARSCFIDWFPMDNSFWGYKYSGPPRAFSGPAETMFITTSEEEGGSSPGKELEKAGVIREDQAQDFWLLRYFCRFSGTSRERDCVGLFLLLFVVSISPR